MNQVAASLVRPEHELQYREAKCASCASADLRLFYEALDVPVHNSLIVSTRDEALQFPRGDVILGLCDRCGFITNVAFDPSLIGYTTAYEEQQTFSPTFSSFQRKLVEHLIARYELRNKDIVEIGCGKGDFLAQICELGPNHGIGIDPSVIPSRLTGPAAARIQFIQDYYSERHAELLGHMICCRHTLEHINQPADFLRSIRRSIGDHDDISVFFEVPDVVRVLHEQAYWDIYYEHCSYFSPGSLARLFRATGFEIVDLSLGYDNQYILLEAAPTQATGLTPHASEESLQEMTDAVELFATHVRARLHQWKVHLRQMRSQGKRSVVWGSGSKGVAFLTAVDQEGAIEYVVDINPHRHGKFILGVGKEIMPPEFLTQYRPDEVIVMNPIYVDEIKARLDSMNVLTDVVAV